MDTRNGLPNGSQQARATEYPRPPLTEEHKIKISEGQKKRHARLRAALEMTAIDPIEDIPNLEKLKADFVFRRPKFDPLSASKIKFARRNTLFSGRFAKR
jgi:hypothetical protein